MTLTIVSDLPAFLNVSAWLGNAPVRVGFIGHKFAT